jgi:serine/threonine-protein kinase
LVGGEQQPSETSRELAPGTKLDRYELVRHVATGGMGSVWQGRFAGKHGFRRLVAIKTILPHLSALPSIRAMFLEEARVGSKLVHANVAQILDVGDDRGMVYIVFEWVEGSSLETLCRGGTSASHRVAPVFLLRVLADVCAGLEAAHALGIVHRDVKPRNILVGNQGFTKLIDFGLAKARDRLCADTRSGLVRGTPEYMPPEQACGAPLDGRADLWSVAAVLHRGLFGAPPFARPASLDLPATLDPDLRGILAQGLARSRDERFSGAGEMRAALIAAAFARNDGKGIPALARLPEARDKDGSAEATTTPEGPAPATRETPNPAPLCAPARDRWTTTLLVSLVVALVASGVAIALAAASLATT